MRTFRKTVACLVAVLMALGVCSAAFTASAAATSGACGEHTTWVIENGTLTISGDGAMYDYPNFDAPWGDGSGMRYYSNIVINPGITYIGSKAFYGSTASSVSIPNTVTVLGDCAFHWSGLTSVTIPGSITSWQNAFNLCLNLSYVTIENGVTTIDSACFGGCSNLSYVSLPDSLTSIGNGAFVGCTSLTSIDLPFNLISIDDGAFQNTGLTTVSLPYSVSTVGMCAFSDSTLTSIELSPYMSSIANGTFWNCASLESVTIPGGVTTIGENAFDGCTSLARVYYGGPQQQWDEITIESGNQELDNARIICSNSPSSLLYCGNNATWSIENGVLSISGRGAMYDYGTTPYLVPDWAYQGFTGVVVGENITSIGAQAFQQITTITSLVTFSGLESIGDNAFCGCTGLTSTVFANNLRNIGDLAFSNCDGLTSFDIPSSVWSLGDYAFQQCDNLTTLTIGSGVTDLGYGTFQECPALTTINYNAENAMDLASNNYLFAGVPNANTPVTVNIGSDVWYIPANLFRLGAPGYGPAITTVNIPVGLSAIGAGAFKNCTTVSDVYYSGTKQQWNALNIGADNDPLTNAAIHCSDGMILPANACGEHARWSIANGVLTISGSGAMYDYQPNGSDTPWALSGESYSSIVIGSGITHIGEWAFGYSPATSVSIPNTVTSIGSNAFSASALTSVTVPGSVTSIGLSAFERCAGLTGITLPENLSEIGSTAFAETGLTSIHIPASVQTIGEDAFTNCDALASISSDEANGAARQYANDYGIRFVYTGETVDLSFHSDHERVAWTADSETYFWSVAVRNDNRYLRLRGFHGGQSAAGTYTWDEMDPEVCFVFPSRDHRVSFTDGSCTVTIDGSIVTVSGTFYGDDGNVYAVTVTKNSADSGGASGATYTLTYDANGGTGAPTAQTGSGFITLAGELPTRDGYTFFGWSDQADSNSVQYQPNGDYELTEDATIYAVWLENTHTWDTITFGSYPQSKVTDETTLAALDALALNWQSYDYYSGTGSHYNGQMTASDYMRYADAVYNGAKYRAVVFDSYRPFSTGYPLTETASYQDNNGYNVNTVYWFRYDPLEWRVLDEAAGLVMCSTVIDSQPYNNYVKTEGTDGHGLPATWGDPAKTYYSCDYANSDLRQWLNDDFYNTAFSAAEKSIILPTTLDNRGCHTLDGESGYEEYDGASTTDNIFVLSYNEVQNSAYGFEGSNSSDNPNRMLMGSDYAKCQGLYSGYVYKSWWLRSPGYYSDEIYVVEDFGNLSPYHSACVTITGVVPALRLSEIPTEEEPVPEDTYSISVGDQVAVNLILDLDTRGLTVSDVSVTLDGQDVDTTVTYDGDQYRFTIITAPAQIADEIVITVGDETITTTVMDYCISLCGHEYDEYEKEQNLAKAILQYGKAANEVFDWTDEEITTFGELDHQPVQNYTGSIFSDGTHQITGASFVALAKPVFRFYMSGVSEADAAAFTGITAAYSDPDLSESEQLNARFLKATKNGVSTVLVEVTGISAENMNEEVIVNIPGLGSFTFNGNAFAKAMANDSDPVTQNLGAALYNYGVAANTCFKPAVQEDEP